MSVAKLFSQTCRNGFTLCVLSVMGPCWLAGAKAHGLQQPGTQLTSASQTIPLQGASDVNPNVTVDAALLPYSVSRRVFGTEIAKRYAVVQLVISNHDQADAMIVQSVLLDYSHWLFSGSFADLSPAPPVGQGLTAQQAANKPSQVASAEARLVRAQLQDAQQWTARNWTVRSAVLIGATAAGFQFLFGESYSKGSDAFNGNLIPGLQQIWPDASQAQINRISDFGFGTNHVIPKNSSDVVVGFFPLDRFLTPDLQEIFRKAPAAFFNPSEMLVDCTYGPKLLNLLRRPGAIEGTVQPELRQRAWNKPCAYRADPGKDQNKIDAERVGKAILHYEKFRLTEATTAPADPVERAKAHEKALAAACNAPKDVLSSDGRTKTPNEGFNSVDCLLLTLLDKVSLNHIRVVASGIMTVDVNRVPAVLSDIKFDGDPKSAALWTGPKQGDAAPVHKAVLIGTFLAGGRISIRASGAGKELPASPLDNVNVDPQNSDETHLAFSYALPADVAPGISLAFTVTKFAKDGSNTTSAPLTFTVPDPAKP